MNRGFILRVWCHILKNNGLNQTQSQIIMIILYLHVLTHTYVYLHVHTHTYTYLHIPTRTYTYLHVHTRTYTYLHILTPTYMYANNYASSDSGNSWHKPILHSLWVNSIQLRCADQTSVRANVPNENGWFEWTCITLLC